jgi:hypothetical protein
MSNLEVTNIFTSQPMLVWYIGMVLGVRTGSKDPTSLFLLWISTVTITHPDVKTQMVFECLKEILRHLWVATVIIKGYSISK